MQKYLPTFCFRLWQCLLAVCCSIILYPRVNKDFERVLNVVKFVSFLSVRRVFLKEFFTWLGTMEFSDESKMQAYHHHERSDHHGDEHHHEELSSKSICQVGMKAPSFSATALVKGEFKTLTYVFRFDFSLFSKNKIAASQ